MYTHICDHLCMTILAYVQRIHVYTRTQGPGLLAAVGGGDSNTQNSGGAEGGRESELEWRPLNPSHGSLDLLQDS